jgi:hypothetical protein
LILAAAIVGGGAVGLVAVVPAKQMGAEPSTTWLKIARSRGREFLESRSERLQDHFVLAARAVSCESDADSIRKILIPGPPGQYDTEDQSRIRGGAVPIGRQAAAVIEDLRDFARMM